jgi:hypothetical protein
MLTERAFYIGLESPPDVDCTEGTVNKEPRERNRPPTHRGANALRDLAD